MRGSAKKRGRNAALLLSAGLLVASGCGGDDFKNEPRPPVPIQVTGVINEKRVTVSPDRLGAGPIVLTVSNLTAQSHTLTLEGEEVRERVGPINPQDTATIQKTLKPGTYEVSAGSSQAVAEEIEPDTLTIGRDRPSGSNDLLLP